MNEQLPAVTDPWISFIDRAMREPTFDVNKLGALLEERRKEQREQQRRAFNRAMSAFQADAEPVLKKAINPHLRSKYATLSDTVEAARPFLRQHGLSVRYVTDPAYAREGWIKLGAVAAHEDGWEDPPIYLEMPVGTIGARGGALAMTPPQAVGAVVSYLRRYLFSLSLNIVSAELEDDDGEAARPMPPPPPRPAPPPKKPTVTEWLDALEGRLEACEGADELDAIINETQTGQARARLTNGALERLETMLRVAAERLMLVPDWHEAKPQPPESMP